MRNKVTYRNSEFSTLSTVRHLYLVFIVLMVLVNQTRINKISIKINNATDG